MFYWRNQNPEAEKISSDVLFKLLRNQTQHPNVCYYRRITEEWRTSTKCSLVVIIQTNSLTGQKVWLDNVIGRRRWWAGKRRVLGVAVAYRNINRAGKCWSLDCFPNRAGGYDGTYCLECIKCLMFRENLFVFIAKHALLPYFTSIQLTLESR